MKIFVHIGLPFCGVGAVQSLLAERRNHLAGKGVLYPRTPGRQNHTRLYMAMCDADHIDPLRWHRGHSEERAQALLAEKVASDLKGEIDRERPDTLILSAEQFGASLHRPSELLRLKSLLDEYSNDIRIVAHLDEQARVLAAAYAEQVIEGRDASLDAELELAKWDDWRNGALAQWQKPDAATNQTSEIMAPAYWLDYEALADAWDDVFGAGSMQFRGFDADVFYSPKLAAEVKAAFEIPVGLGSFEPTKPLRTESAATLARARALNPWFRKAQNTGRNIPRRMWRKMNRQVGIRGATIDPGSLGAVSKHFLTANKALIKSHPGLNAACLKPSKKAKAWSEADPEMGFRASQYMTVFLPQIDAENPRVPEPVPEPAPARHDEPDHLPPLALANYNKLRGGRFAPHNNTGRVNEEELAAQFPAVEKAKLAKDDSGTVVVGCMKNEAPYIIEWIAYHRAIGVDNFLIYTNDCTDGTSEILDRLQEMGIIQHRNNDEWKGNSPQQNALNKSLKEPLIQNAKWIAHIDVDEFINVRCGDGTIAAFLKRVPDATNIAMTWRLFGHNGVTGFVDRPVLEQFDTCAPKHCPKPHTVWGFKTMFKNIGAYEKISCHRPNKLKPGKADKVHWVNGSGQPMGQNVKEKGWRSELKTVGYDLIQLNHYALRSAESFLIKRQRGRALHVDRTIGLNYWVRMDWSDNKDVTIQRNLDRMGREMWALLEDETLAALHAGGVVWHKAKAAELHKKPEFQELYDGALSTKLNELERVAYALALDMES